MLTLFDDAISPFARKVRLVLARKGPTGGWPSCAAASSFRPGSRGRGQPRNRARERRT